MCPQSDPTEPVHTGRSKTDAARAAVVMGLLMTILWTVQIFDSLTHYPLLRFGIEPRSVGKLEDILTAPFIHESYSHLSGNTVPLLILGFVVALRGVWRFVLITCMIIIVSGFGVWLTASPGTDTVGASGVIFGYFGYLVGRGVFERHLIDILIGLLIGALYWSILPDLLPGNPGISWQAHLFGLIGGILAAWLFHQRRAYLPATG